MITVIAVLLAYLIGSISSAILVCKIMRLPDPRTQGSRNPGATNVLRIGGKKAAVITLLGDTLKGFIPVLLAKLLGLDALTVALVMFAAFMGHLYPVFFRFEGGKGVATLIGCLLALNWPAGCAFLITWVAIAAIFRFSSLASLTAAFFAPVFVWHFTHENYFYLATLVMCLILIVRHRQNIRNLLEGKESKIGKRVNSTH